MTSTNDGKEVKINLSSGPKGKTYFIELYKSLEANLNEAGSACERTKHLCEAWKRIHNLCLHSATSTHSHLLSWLQKHTARAVLQTGWQSPDRKEERSSLAEAINVLIVESRSAAASRDGVSPPWEQQLVARGEWFKRVLDRPWEHPVLNCLLNPDGTPPNDDEVLEWLKEERGITFVMRLQTLVAEKQCDDIAVALATAVMDRVRSHTQLNPDADQTEEPKDKPEWTSPGFGDRLKLEAGFTQEVWELLIDIEFVLLHKRDCSRCIALAKQTPLRSAYQLIERLQCRLDTSPREKRLWKNSKEVAVLIAQVVIARCMVVPQCTGGARSALYCCARSLARLMPSSRLPSAAAALAAPAPTAAHLHTLAAAVDAQLALKTDASMKPFVCELYVRAITAGMNELERLKLKTEKDTEARSMEQTLATWFVQLGAVLACSDRFKCECALTAFSVHPSPQMYERIKVAPALPPIHLDSVEATSTEATNPEFGSWASDSRSQTNFVKTSETLNMKARQNQANVLSMAIFNEGEALGLSPELCQDITALLSGPRVKTLSWDMDRELLLENCRAYLERTHGGTKAVTTELKYLNLNPADFQYLPEEDEDENNIYYGIEKGYEHLVVPEPEDIWEDAYEHFEKADPAYSSEEYDFIQPQRKKKTKKPVSNSDEDDPLSYVAETKRKEKKERPHSKERCKEKKKLTDPLEKKVPEDKTAPGDPLEIGEGSQVKKDKPKRVRKKKDKIPQPTDGSLCSLVGLKVGKSKRKPKNFTTDSDADSQGISSIQSMNSEDNVLYDGQFSMEDLKSPQSSHSPDSMSLMQNNEFTLANRRVGITHKTHQSPFSRPNRPASISNVRMTSPSPYKPQSPSEQSRNNSPVHISEEVKSSISKLLEFRRLKSNAIMRETSLAIDNNISPKAVAIPEIPKSYINKQQSEKIIELKQKVDDLLKQRKQSDVAIPSPVIQYANRNYTSTGQHSKSYSSSRSQYNTMHKDQRTPLDRCFSTPPMDTSDRFLNSVSLISIYDKNEPPHLLNPFAVKSSPYSTVPERRQSNVDMSVLNYKDYLHEFHRHNAYNQYAERKESTKKVIRPTSRVTPVVPNMKSEPQTLQSAKQQPLKKPDGSLNTFSRLSYYKNKQTDMRNKSQDTQQNQTQTVGSKLDGFILDHLVQSQRSDKLSNDGQTMIRNYAKSQINTCHPIIANMLQGNAAQAQSRPQSVTPPKTELSENDQNDMLLLLRQQGTLNKSQNLSNASCSKAIPSMRNPPVASCSKIMISGTDAIYNSNSSIMSSNPQISQPKETKRKVNEGKMINILSTSIIKSAEPKKESKPKPTNTKKPIAQGKSKKTESRRQQKPAAKPDMHKDPEEWENVMNAILKQKTPCRGPNALDMALNKSSFEKAFEESLRKPPMLFMSSDTAQDNISRDEYNHEQFVTPKSKTATSSTSITLSNENKKINSLLKTQNLSPEPKKNTRTKKSPNIVEKIMKQHKIEPKVFEDLMQQNQIEITRKNTNNTQIEIPEKTLKHSNIIKPIDAAQRQTEISEMHAQHISTEMPEKAVKPTHFEIPMKNAKQIIETSKKDTKQVVAEKHNKEAKHAEMFKKIPREGHMKQFTYARPKQEDPFISGIPNSDYDLLDELMDDDLRKEIGELSSDEESYNASAQGFLQDVKTGKKPVSVVYNHPLNEVVAKPPHNDIVVKAHPPICKQNEMAQSFAEKPQQRPNNKEPTLVKITPTRPNQDKAVMGKNVTNVQNIVVTHEMAKPCQARSYSNDDVLHTTHMTVEPNVYIAAVPRPAPVQNVMLISSDLVYEGYSSVQTPIQAVTNIAPNVYMAVNNATSVNVYQTSQFAAPVVSPLEIASAVTVPVLHNVPCVTTVQSKPVTKVTHSQYSDSNNKLHDPTHSATAHGHIVVDDNKLDAKACNTVTNHVVENDMQRKQENITLTNVNTKRKILKEVQEKQAHEKIDSKRRSQKGCGDLKTQADKERLMKKRMTILNRKINHFCGVQTIALGYSPLRLTISIEQKDRDVIDKKTAAENNIPSIQNNLQELNNEVKSPATPDSHKENKSETVQVRRILLRSSNKLKSKISSSLMSPKPYPDKKLSPVVSLVNSNETPSDNDQSDLKTNNKQKRVSKRIRNKSVATPKDDQNKETKVARSKVPSKKATGTPKVSKNNKPNKISSTIENVSSNQDFDTEQFFDIEAELLGSTIPKMIPINFHSLDPHEVSSPVTNEKETRESLTPNLEEAEPLPIQDDQLQKGKDLSVNKTKFSEQLDSVKISIESSDITVIDSSGTNKTEQINNDLAKTSDLIISAEVRSAETEITKEKDENILEYEKIFIANESVSESIKTDEDVNQTNVSESIKTNKNDTQTTEVNTSNQVDGTDTVLASEQLPNLEFINTPTSTQVHHNHISKSDETQTLPVNLQKYSTKTDNFNHKNIVDQTNIAHAIIDLNKSRKTDTPQIEAAVANDDDIEIIADTPSISPPSYSAAHKTKQPHSKASKDSIVIEKVTTTDNRDPLKEEIRIKLGNGKTFRGTVSGSIDIETLMKDPEIMSLLARQFQKPKKLYALKINVNKDVTNGNIVLSSQQAVKPQIPLETVSLLSDDEEEEVSQQVFETEYGKYKISSMDRDIFTKHQNKFKLKSYVPVKKFSLAEENIIKCMANANCTVQTQPECVTLDFNTINLESPPSVVCAEKLDEVEILSAIPTKYVQGIFDDIKNILAPLNKDPKEEPIVLIDDSSNDSVKHDKTPEPNEKIYELKYKLLKDLGVDNILTATNESTHDVQVTWASEAIDLTDDSVMETTECPHKEDLTDDTLMNSTECFDKEKLNIQVDFQKIINRNYFVKLVRCDHLVNPPSKPKHIEIKEDKSRETDAMPAPVSRSGSFSILEEFPDTANSTEKKEYELCRSSPVMEVYDSITLLERKTRIRNIHKLSADLLKCDSEWMSTKKIQHVQCLNKLTVEQVSQSFVVPKLSTLIFSFMQKGDLVNKYNILSRFHPLPISLKRKSKPTSCPITKISKLDNLREEPHPNDWSRSSSITLDLSATGASDVTMTDDDKIETEENLTLDAFDIPPGLSDTEVANIKISLYNDKEDMTLINKDTDYKEKQAVDRCEENAEVNKILDNCTNKGVEVCRNDNDTVLTDTKTKDEPMNNSLDLSGTTVTSDYKDSDCKDNQVVGHHKENVKMSKILEECIIKEGELCQNENYTIPADVKTKKTPMNYSLDIITSDVSKHHLTKFTEDYQTMKISKEISVDASLELDDDIPIDCSIIDFCVEQTEEDNCHLPISSQTDCDIKNSPSQADDKTKVTGIFQSDVTESDNTNDFALPVDETRVSGVCGMDTNKSEETSSRKAIENGLIDEVYSTEEEFDDGPNYDENVENIAKILNDKDLSSKVSMNVDEINVSSIFLCDAEENNITIKDTDSSNYNAAVNMEIPLEIIVKSDGLPASSALRKTKIDEGTIEKCLGGESQFMDQTKVPIASKIDKAKLEVTIMEIQMTDEPDNTNLIPAQVEEDDDNKIIVTSISQSVVTESDNSNDFVLPVGEARVDGDCGMDINKSEGTSSLKSIENGLIDVVSSTEKELDGPNYDKNTENIVKILNVEKLSSNVSMDVDEKKVNKNNSCDAERNNITIENTDSSNCNVAVHVEIPLEIIVKSDGLRASGALRETKIDKGTIEKCLRGDSQFKDRMKVPIASKSDKAILEVTIMEIQMTDEPVNTNLIPAQAEVDDDNKVIVTSIFQSDVTESDNSNDFVLPVGEARVDGDCGMDINKSEGTSSLKSIENGLIDVVSSTEKELDDGPNYDKNTENIVKILNVEKFSSNVSIDVDEKKVNKKKSCEAEQNKITIKDTDSSNYNVAVHVEIPLEIIVKSDGLRASGALCETKIDDGTIEKCIGGDSQFMDQTKVPFASKIDNVSLEVTIMEMQKTDEHVYTNLKDKSNGKLADDSYESRNEKCDLQAILNHEQGIQDSKDIESEKNTDHAIHTIHKLEKEVVSVMKQSYENISAKQEDHFKNIETSLLKTTDEIYDALNKMFGESENKLTTDMSEFIINEQDQNQNPSVSNEKSDSCIFSNGEQKQNCVRDIVKFIGSQDIEKTKISNEKVCINNISIKQEKENATSILKKSEKSEQGNYPKSSATPMPRTADEIYEALNKMFGEPEDVNSVNVSVVVITEDSKIIPPNNISKMSNDDDQLNIVGDVHADAKNGLSSQTEDSGSEIWVEEVVDMLNDEIIEDITMCAMNSTFDVKEIERNNIEDLESGFSIQEEVVVQEIKIESMTESTGAKCYSSLENITGNNKRSAKSKLNTQNIIGEVEAKKEKHVLDNTILEPNDVLKLDTPDQEIEIKNEFKSTFAKYCNDNNMNSENRTPIALNASSMLGQYPESTRHAFSEIKYEDSDIGTGYMLSKIDKDSEANKKFSQISKSKENVANNFEDEVVEDIEIIMPKHTYACPNGLISEMVRRSSRNMKRKKDMSDIKTCEKKYRKGKNIDQTKITTSAIADLAYAKEYKRIIDYCSTIKFSYARPFHIENIVVSDMHRAWPIQMCHANEVKYSTNVEELLFTDTIDNENAMATTDPLKQTLNEEIENREDVNKYTPIDINEINFNMGFGERSGRVIQKIETGITKLSAATLSDVKQYQPFSMSEVSKVNLNLAHKIETQKVKSPNFMGLINLKEKVQSFFKKTAIELTKELFQDKKYVTYDCNISKFPFALTSTEFFEISRLENFVNVVQVDAAAQNPVTCDPRVTHVSDASPSQCSDNSTSEDPQATMETEYTELTTANITLPLVQEYAQHRQLPSKEQHSSKTDDDVNASIPTMSIVKIELMEEETSQENLENDIYENDFSPLPNNNVEYSFEETTNTLYNTSANAQNTSNTGNTPNNVFNASSNVDITFTRMFNNTNNMDNAYTNMDNTPSSMESTYTNTTSMYSTSSDMGNSSTELATANMDDAAKNMDTTATNVDNTATNVDNVSTNMDNTYTNMYPLGSDSNDMNNTTTNGGNIDNNLDNSSIDLENRPSNMNSTSNVDDSDLENTAYDYSYENIEDYAANMENNNNAENYSTSVDNYAANAENYSSNVDDYASNVNNYSTNENYSTDVENYASNVENYPTNIENYSSNVENYASNADNTTSNTDNNLTTIENSTASLLEDPQPQDLSMGNSTQESKMNTFESRENEPSKTDQIAHAMNAAGISSESVITSGANELVNLISQSTQVTANNYTKPAPANQQINVMTLQQALAQVLPPPLNQTGTSENQMPNNPVAQQVLHIVQGNNAQTVINKPNGTHLLHIVQNKSNPAANGLSLVDAGLQQGGNQLIHIVNNANQNNAQFLKRVNLLTNLTNAQGSNEQKMIQFVCKSADGKSIQLNAGPQRSMVLRLHPSSVQTMPKPTEPQDLGASSGGENAVNSEDPSQEIKSRSVYEENYAQFIQNSAPTPGSSTPPCLEKSTSLPKFNQVFGKQSYQENQNEINHNGLQENSECSPEENNGNLEQPAEVNNPPLLERNAPPETTQSPPNPVQQIKQAISPMNIHTTMHGGVIYTRQIPVNIGGGQTINLITVPSTEMVDDSAQKQQTESSFVNQEAEPSSIIKLVPHHAPNNTNVTPEENNAQAGPSNEPNHNPQPQPQPVLTQMRIKLPMLSKGPHIMPGARLVRPSFFQIQRNVIAGTNQPVYQQLVLTTAPSLGQTIRIPVQGPSSQSPQTQPILVQAAQHAQPSPHIPVQQVKHAPSSQHVQSARQAHSAPPTTPPRQPEHTKPDKPDSELSPLTLEQLREFDMVLEQVKERSVQPTPSTTPITPVLPKQTPADSTDGPTLATTSVSESTQQVLYSVENNQPTNVVSYVNRKSTITSATTSFARSPDSSGIVDTPPSATEVQVTHTITSKSSTAGAGSTAVAHPKRKKKKKSSSSSSAMASLGSPSKTNSSLKPQEDEQTTQRILYILAEYKEQVENSPDKNKPAPRRRNQFPPTTGSKRKRSHCSSRALCRRDGAEMSPMHGEHGENGEDSLITIGSEDSSCGTTFSECTECQESHSPEDSPTKVVRRLTFEQETTTQTITQTRTHTALPQRNVIVGDGQTITVARTTTATTAKPTTTVLMPANYLLPVSMIKGGQQIAIMTNRGPKILVGAGDTNAGALLFQRLIGPGLKPILARPGVRHIRLPATALHNVQTFNIQTTPVTQVQPGSTAPQAPTPAPPDLVDTRAMSSPWQDREDQDKPERGPSPDCTEPWNLPSSSIADDYGYEEIVRTDNMERTILDAIPDRYSPDMEAQRIFDKMFDVDSKKSMYDSPRCAYDIDTSDGDDRPYHQVVQQRKDGRHHRVTHVSTAALRHKYAILEHELRLQKSLSEECEDLGVDSPSASDLFPEADILFGAPSPAHEQTIDQCNTPPPIPITQGIPQPDLDDQIATDHLLTHSETRHDDLDLNLDDVGEIVTVGEDGVATIPTINAEEFARSHPNTTFHTEPEVGEITIAQPPFTIAQAVKGRHITFHANRMPGTVVMAPQTTVISQATLNSNHANSVKFTDIDNMINSMPCPRPVTIAAVPVREPIVSTRPLSKLDSYKDQGNSATIPLSKFDSIKDPGVSAPKPLSKFDSLLSDSKLQLSNSARHIVHSAGHGTQVIRRLRYDEKTNTRKNTRFHFELPRARTSVSDEVKMRNDRAIVESMGDNASSPGQPELFWDSTTTERHESRFHFSGSEKTTKSPFDELLNDSSAYGPHTRLDSVIKAARPERTYERTSFEGISVSSDDSRPLRTYPPKRGHTQDTERHFTLKTTTTTTHELDRTTTKTTHHHELGGKKTTLARCQESEGRRRTGRGLVKRGCSCCSNGSTAPPKKRSRPKKASPPDFSPNS